MDFYKEDLFEYALTIGMTAEQYWFGDPALIYTYESVYQNQQKLKQQDMWLMGQYIKRAIESSVVNVAGFIEKKSQVGVYPECPHTDLFTHSKPLTEEQKALLRQARARLSERNLLGEDT